MGKSRLMVTSLHPHSSFGKISKASHNHSSLRNIRNRSSRWCSQILSLAPPPSLVLCWYSQGTRGSPADQGLMATPPAQLIEQAVDGRMLSLVKGLLLAVIPFQHNAVAKFFEGSVVPHINTLLPPKAMKMTTGLFCDLVFKVYIALASLVPLLWWMGVSPAHVKQWISQQCSASRATLSTLRNGVTSLMALGAQLGDTRRQLEQREGEFAVVKEELTEVKGGLTEVKGELTEVKGELTEVKGELTEVKGELTEVKGELTEVKGELTEVKGELTEVKGELTEVKGELTEVKGELTEVKGELTEVKGELTEVKGELTEVKGELTEVKGELTGVNGELAAVKGELAAVKGELAAVKGELAAVKGELAAVKGDLAEHKDRARILSMHLEETRHEVEDAERSRAADMREIRGLLEEAERMRAAEYRELSGRVEVRERELAAACGELEAVKFWRRAVVQGRIEVDVEKKVRKSEGVLKQTWQRILSAADEMDLNLGRLSCLSDAILAHVSTMTHLKTIDLDGSAGFTAEGISYLFCLPRLAELDLRNTAVSDAALEGIKAASSLEYLSLVSTHVSNTGLQHLTALATLKSVWLDKCKGVTNAGMVHVGRLIGLGELGLAGTGVSTDGLHRLTALTSLQVLVLPAGATVDYGGLCAQLGR
ncbi:unnamed protein product [Closterium sp. Yama58-4]|nr:unnamed protein product [Closterium sp. Yama58-4]